jgi:hypothetical protein
MEAIKAFLDLVKVAHPQSHKNLAHFPLFAPETGSPDFLTLEEVSTRPWWKSPRSAKWAMSLMLNSINQRRPRSHEDVRPLFH